MRSTISLLIAALSVAAISTSPLADADNVPQVSGTPHDWYLSVCVDSARRIPAAVFQHAADSNVCRGLNYGGLVAMAKYTGSDDLDKLAQDLQRLSRGAPIAVGRNSNGLWAFLALRDEIGAQQALGNIQILTSYGFTLVTT